MEVAVGVAGQSGAFGPVGVFEALLGAGGQTEVGPPQRGGDQDSEDGGGEHDRLLQVLAGPGAQPDDGFTERDDDDEAVALDEVGGHYPENLDPGDQGSAEVDDGCADPEQLSVWGWEGGDGDQDWCDEQARGQPQEACAEVFVVVGGVHDEQDQVDDADGEQGKPEDEGSGAERGRECACGQQHRSHGGDDQAAKYHPIRSEGVGEPRVADPGPPHRQ
ncbi:hypothetical protein GCM10009763_26630 [Dermacoccus profundi]|uniref:Uncharacterized protein n=1 Tax=Dermacoccus profundi TaxID=322602 RepID=A0ABN2DIF5_9MICO